MRALVDLLWDFSASIIALAMLSERDLTQMCQSFLNRTCLVGLRRSLTTTSGPFVGFKMVSRETPSWIDLCNVHRRHSAVLAHCFASIIVPPLRRRTRRLRGTTRLSRASIVIGRSSYP